jgi:hypothetical protein
LNDIFELPYIHEAAQGDVGHGDREERKEEKVWKWETNTN